MQNLQVPFIANEGQVDESVAFYAKTFGGTVFVTKNGEIVYSLPAGASQASCRDTACRVPARSTGIALKEEFIGAKVSGITGEGESVTKVSYFKGSDPSKWKSNIATYEVADMGEVYKGIGLKLRAHGNNVEKLFTVAGLVVRLVMLSPSTPAGTSM